MKINQVKAGAILSLISMGIGYLISIIYTPIMLRLLGQSEYGLYNLVASVVSNFGLFSFGFGSAYMRYYSRYKVKGENKNIARLNGMFLIIFSVIAIIVVLAGTVFASNVDIIFGNQLTKMEISTARILLMIMIANMAISFLTTVFNAHIIANEKYVFQKTLLILKNIVSPFVTIPILLLGYKSIGLVTVTTIFSVIVEIANVAFCFKKLKIMFIFKGFDFRLMKEMTIFSSYIFLNMIIDQINWNVDKFILGRVRGTIAVAIYGLAAQLNTYYLSLSVAISSVFIPRVNIMVAGPNDDKELSTLFARIGRIQFILLSLILTGIVFFGQSFINKWAGKNYTMAYPILLILIISETIPLIQNIGIEIQRAKNMHKFRSIVYFFIALGNLTLSIPLAKAYGGVGAAIGTAIAQVIGNTIIMNIYYQKKVGIDIQFFWREMLKLIPSLIIPLSMGIVIYNAIDLTNNILFLISGIFYVAVYCSSVWFFGMNTYEKNLLREPLKKIKNIIS